MKLTKYEHACLILEKAGSTLVIDPGSFTMPLADLDNVVGIVVTHEHADHWTPEQLARLLDRNPEARILGPAGVATAATEATVEVVAAGDEVEVGPFGLKFFGEKHAVIHESIPVIDNVGVLVEETLYYAGDSYTVPEGVEVDTLAAPAGAPWLKVGEVMDYVISVKPKRVFPVHEAGLSQIGRNMVNGRLEWAAQQGGGELFVLEAGESSEI
jgi:L-ascorbate metabolism protein UlaG (beta-lactamase superfamily)